ncbi:hypothetical protein RCL1_000596 [Eukaryota sp. TZLM3-RCL]
MPPTSSALDDVPVVPSATMRSAAAKALERELELLRLRAGELSASVHPSSFIYPTNVPLRVTTRPKTQVLDVSDTESICSNSSTSSVRSRSRKRKPRPKSYTPTASSRTPSSKRGYYAPTMRELALEQEVATLKRKNKYLEQSNQVITTLKHENDSLRESVKRLETVRIQQRSLIAQLRSEIEALSSGLVLYRTSPSLRKTRKKSRK